jgi:mRNA export factor
MVVGAGTDNTARLLDLGANGSSAQQVALHAGPIRSVRFLEVPNTREQLIVTGSWDKTVRYWDPRSPSLVGSLLVNEKVHSLDVKDSTLVVATAERKIHIVDLTDPTRISRSPVNPLLHQIRVVSCFPNSQGFAVGGIEGRVGIIWANEAHSRYDLSSSIV